MIARLLLAILILGSTAASERVRTSSCNPTPSERTHWGNVVVVLNLQKKPLKSLWGTVRDSTDPVDGVLIEVYPRHGDNAEPQGPDREATIESRVSACITGKAGDFSFDLPSGRYEIRSSRADWKTTSVLVVIDTKKGKKTPVDIQLQVGT
jgi:hypothetical protein